MKKIEVTSVSVVYFLAALLLLADLIAVVAADFVASSAAQRKIGSYQSTESGHTIIHRKSPQGALPVYPVVRESLLESKFQLELLFWFDKIQFARVFCV